MTNKNSKILNLDCVVFGLQRFGGISNYWRHLLDGISETSDFLEANLIMPKKIIYGDIESFNCDKFTLSKERFPSYITRYLHCKTHQANSIFHTSYYRTPSKASKGHVVTAYDFMYERYRKGLPKALHTIQKRKSLNAADLVSCISSFTRNEIIEFFPEVDSSKLKVVHLGVETDTFYPEKLDDFREFETSVLFVGERKGYKRFDLAVAAISTLIDLNLLIVGPPLTIEEKNKLDLILPLRWKELGYVSSSTLRKVYSSALAFIFPSDCEGFGLPLLEAAACGCPVISSSGGSLPEIGLNSVLYAKDQRYEDYADALYMLRDEKVRNKFIELGLMRVLDFSWVNTVKKTLDIYEYF